VPEVELREGILVTPEHRLYRRDIDSCLRS
jgi:hypothetical protein